MRTTQRQDALSDALMYTLQFIGKDVINTLVQDSFAHAVITSIPDVYRPYFQQKMSSEQFTTLLIQELQKGSSSVLEFLDDYATHVMSSPEHEILTAYPFHGGLIAWRGIRAALLETHSPSGQELDVVECEELLDRASAFLLWCIADAIADRAFGQHGWYDLNIDYQHMPEHMQKYTPPWLRELIETKRPELLFSEMSVYPLSDRVLLFVDNLAKAGQVEFPDALCNLWSLVRSLLKRVPSLSERTFAHTEVFALDDEQHAREFDDLCERKGLPRTFTKRERGSLAEPLRLFSYLVDFADLVLLSAASNESLSDWLLDTGMVQEAVRLRTPLDEDVDRVAEDYRRAHFAVCTLPDKLLVQLTREVQVNTVREGKGCR